MKLNHVMKLASICLMSWNLGLVAKAEEPTANTSSPAAVELNAKEVKLGTISNPEYTKATQAFTLKRTAKTPEEVVLSYELLAVKKGCVEFDVEVTQVAELKQTNCTPNLTNGHECEEVTFPAYQTAKRVCKKEGLQLTRIPKSIELNFKKAITLSAKADELFEVVIDQQNFQNGKVTLRAQAVESDSVYKIKVSGETVKFKAE